MNGLLSIGRAAAFLRVDPQTLRRWHARGALVPTHIEADGGRWYSQEALDAFVAHSPGVAQHAATLALLQRIADHLGVGTGVDAEETAPRE